MWYQWKLFLYQHHSTVVFVVVDELDEVVAVEVEPL